MSNVIFPLPSLPKSLTGPWSPVTRLPRRDAWLRTIPAAKEQALSVVLLRLKRLPQLRPCDSRKGARSRDAYFRPRPREGPNVIITSSCNRMGSFSSHISRRTYWHSTLLSESPTPSPTTRAIRIENGRLRSVRHLSWTRPYSSGPSLCSDVLQRFLEREEQHLRRRRHRSA